jgi:hypothetical protein
MGLAIGHTALAAPAGLLGGAGSGILRVDLAKIAAARVGCALVGHRARDIDEFQHRLLCHERPRFDMAFCEMAKFQINREWVVSQGPADEKTGLLTFNAANPAG